MLSSGLRVLITLVVLLRAGSGVAAGDPALSGTVYDSTGGALVGAVVAAIADDGEVLTAVTDRQGAYAFAELRPGEYAIRAEFPGFALRTHTVVIARGRHARADFSLEIVLQEQVDVVETVGLSDSPLSRTLTRKELALLPTDSRQMLQRLRELAGTRGELGDVAIYVDGFREGLRLPPK